MQRQQLQLAASAVEENDGVHSMQAQDSGGGHSHGMLVDLIGYRSTPSTLLRPLAFFVSWQGVLCLAFSGFTPALSSLKADLNNLAALGTEASGSRWPKISLGCLKDSGRLTPPQLKRLNAICRLGSGQFQRPNAPRSQAVLVDQVEIVLYENRCQERVLSVQPIPLDRFLDVAEPSSREQERVSSIVAEAEQPGYWFHASKDGGRETHYRGPAVGATLVHQLACFKHRPQVQQLPYVTHPVPIQVQVPAQVLPQAQVPASTDGLPVEEKSEKPEGLSEKLAATTVMTVSTEKLRALSVYSSALPALIQAFRTMVNKELPGDYTWFEDSSLHITIRSLMR